MIVDIQTRRLRTIGQLCAFVEGNEAVDFQPRDREEAYGFVRDTLDRFGYRHLGKHDKGVVLKFLVAATGISLQQTERLVRQWRETGAVRDRRGGSRGRPFARKYTAADIRLLAEVDEAYGQMSGLATREVLRRQFEVFGDPRFERLATISNGHVYNLRGSATYRAKRTVWTKTQGTAVAIGLRQAPEPEGRPGHVRVDTVHQGDRDGVKGIYLINLVDEVTQYEFAAPWPASRSASFCREGLLLSFPVLGFHADNRTSTTASPIARKAPRRAVHQVPRPTSNDNASRQKRQLVRRRPHQRFAPDVSRLHGTLSPFLNFHRPCLFATGTATTPARSVARSPVTSSTPYDRSLPRAGYLKPGMASPCSAAAAAETDLHAARRGERRALLALPPAWPRRAPPDERRDSERRAAAPRRGPGTPALAAGFGGRVARREGMFPAARHPSPISRDDRRSLPPRVLSRQARQGSAAPTATPRRRARTRRRHQGFASPAAVPASRSPLTRHRPPRMPERLRSQAQSGA